MEIIPKTIIFEHVSKTYEQTHVPALKNVSLTVNQGEFLCIVGPSGCGKSTVLKIIADLDANDSGEVKKPANVSMVFQSGALFPWLTVYENIEFVLKAKKLPEYKIKEDTHHFIELTGLKEHIHAYPRELSGGQRQRVGIARALSVDPKVLLMDEPFSALDTLTTEELHRDLLSIWKQMNMTIVMVSHSIEEAVSLADRIILMKDGRIDETFTITLPRPRREQQELFIRDVHMVRNKLMKK